MTVWAYSPRRRPARYRGRAPGTHQGPLRGARSLGPCDHRAMAETQAATEAAAPNQLFPGKQFISTVLEALDTKTRMTGNIAQRYLMRAAMAGMIVAVF